MTTEERLEKLERELAIIRSGEGERMMASRLMPAMAHLAETRGVFLMEILRERGLLDGLPLDAIEARVRDVVAGESIPYDVSKKTALEHIDGILSEIAGDYSWADD